MNAEAIAAQPTISIHGSWPWRIAVAVMLVALADWLFFRHDIGVSIALFILALSTAVLLTNRIEVKRRELFLYGGVLVAALLPALEDFNVMSVLFAALGVGAFALGITGALRGSLKERVLAVLWFLLSGPFQFFCNLPLVRDWARGLGAPVTFKNLQGWIVPLAFGTIFLALFAAANPLIANWLSQWRFGDSFRELDMQRLFFWVYTTMAVWAFVFVAGRFVPPDLSPVAVIGNEPDLATGIPATPYSDLIFNDRVILRSLVLFNLLFVVQTALDFNYLWRGAALPDGMSYASYAHRGAYPLIVTALLAAAFVVIAMRPGSAAERSPLMRALVFLWVGQNVLLVVSSILRLDLYVEIYLLTYWRVAAFIWMLIVAMGLILIVVRIVTCRSTAWLITANATVLMLTIYICSFINFASLVANYNVSHGQDIANTGRPIDLSYIAALGPHAIPALDRYLATHAGQPAYFKHRRDLLAAALLGSTADWRAWTFRGWRLSLYLRGFWFNQP